MNARINNGSAPPAIQLKNIVKDFSQYLLFQKKHSHPSLSLSKETLQLMENWGRQKQTAPDFRFSGPDDAKVFIVDRDLDFYEGKGGQLLIKILAAMKLAPREVFICNAADLQQVHDKITAVAPRIIITLGETSGRLLLNTQDDISTFQGKFHDYHGIRVMPTFHPSLLIDQPQYKRPVWEAMKKVMALTGIVHGS